MFVCSRCFSVVIIRTHVDLLNPRDNSRNRRTDPYNSSRLFKTDFKPNPTQTQLNSVAIQSQVTISATPLPHGTAPSGHDKTALFTSVSLSTAAFSKYGETNRLLPLDLIHKHVVECHSQSLLRGGRHLTRKKRNSKNNLLNLIKTGRHSAETRSAALRNHAPQKSTKPVRTCRALRVPSGIRECPAEAGVQAIRAKVRIGCALMQNFTTSLLSVGSFEVHNHLNHITQAPLINAVGHSVFAALD